MNGDILTFTGELTVTTCWCGIHLAVPSDLYKAAKRNTSQQIHCPLGHTFVFRESEAARLRKENERLQRSVQTNRESAEFWREQQKGAERRAAAARGQVTKMRNRIAKGVCPAPGCKRSGFDDVAAHIASAHPGFHAHES